MIDTATNKPLRVLTNGKAGPHLWLPFGRLDEIRRLLDARGIGYEVDEDVFSFNGGPEITVVHLGRSGDAVAVQAILDGVP